MTADAMEGVRDNCLAAGMNDYVRKPVRVEELVRALETAAPAEAAPSAAAVGYAPPPEPLPESEAAVAPALAPRAERAARGSDLHGGFDRSVLLALYAELDDADLVVNLVDIFLADTPKLLATLREATTSASADAAYRAAHTLKATCGTIGAPELAARCAQIEAAGLTGRAAPEALAALEAGFPAVASALAALKAELLAQRSAASVATA